MRGPNRMKVGQARQLRRAQTDVERKLWYRINNRALGGHKFVRQEPVGPYIADFVCRAQKLVLELDGSQHAGSEHDRIRDAYLGQRGYRVLRFWNSEVIENLDGVLETIVSVLDAGPPPHPTLSPQAGRGVSFDGAAADGRHPSSPRLRGEGLVGGPADEASEAQRSEGEGPSTDKALSGQSA